MAVVKKKNGAANNVADDALEQIKDKREKKVQFIGQVTDEELTALKAKYPGLYSVFGKEDVTYFKLPSFSELDYVYSKQDEAHPMEMWKEAFNMTKVAGSDAPISNPQKFMPVMRALREAFGGEEAVLVKY